MRVPVKITAGRTDWVQLRAGYVLRIDPSSGGCKVWYRGTPSEEPLGAKTIAAGSGLQYFGPFDYQQGFQIDATTGPVTYLELPAAKVVPATGDLPSVTMTQAEYDALVVKDPRTLYNVTA